MQSQSPDLAAVVVEELQLLPWPVVDVVAVPRVTQPREVVAVAAVVAVVEATVAALHPHLMEKTRQATLLTHFGLHCSLLKGFRQELMNLHQLLLQQVPTVEPRRRQAASEGEMQLQSCCYHRKQQLPFLQYHHLLLQLSNPQTKWHWVWDLPALQRWLCWAWSHFDYPVVVDAAAESQWCYLHLAAVQHSLLETDSTDLAIETRSWLAAAAAAAVVVAKSPPVEVNSSTASRCYRQATAFAAGSVVELDTFLQMKTKSLLLLLMWNDRP